MNLQCNGNQTFGLQTCAERFKYVYNMLERKRKKKKNMLTCSVLLKLASLLNSWKAPLPRGLTLWLPQLHDKKMLLKTGGDKH